MDASCSSPRHQGRYVHSSSTQRTLLANANVVRCFRILLVCFSENFPWSCHDRLRSLLLSSGHEVGTQVRRSIVRGMNKLQSQFGTCPCPVRTLAGGPRKLQCAPTVTAKPRHLHKAVEIRFRVKLSVIFSSRSSLSNFGLDQVIVISGSNSSLNQTTTWIYSMQIPDR